MTCFPQRSQSRRGRTATYPQPAPPTLSRTLAHAHELGLTVIFATARPPASALRLVGHVAPISPVICSNGAVVYDAVARRRLRTQVMRLDVVRQIIGYIRDRFPHAVVAVDCALRTVGPMRTMDPEWPDNWVSRIGNRTLWKMDKALPPPRSVICMMVLGAWRTHHEVPSIWPVAVTSSAEGLIDFGAQSANKLSALRWLCDRIGVAMDEIVAFGDMPNDVELLRASGMSVAVANAHEQVGSVAPYVTDSNDDDGVARFLEIMMSG